MRNDLFPIGKLLVAKGYKPTPQILKEALDQSDLQWAKLLLGAGCRADAACAIQLSKRYGTRNRYQTSLEQENAVARLVLDRLPDIDIPLMRCPWKINKWIFDRGGGRLNQPSPYGLPALVELLGGDPLRSWGLTIDVISIQLMLDSGYDVDLKDPQGRTALMVAVWDGNVEATQLLLAEGADPHAQYQGQCFSDYCRQTVTDLQNSKTLPLLPSTTTLAGNGNRQR